MDDFLIIYGMNFDTAHNWRMIKTFMGFMIHKHEKSASQSDNAAFRGDDDENTKEEEVYQDLCAIQNSIASRREQVFMFIISQIF
jgi:hypothetical protein